MLRSRMIPDAEDEDEEANRQIRKVKKGRKIQNQQREV